MKQLPQLGLLGAGPLRSSFVLRLTGLRERLGPVAGRNYRLASRMVNTIRAGYAVREPHELGKASSILLSVPDELVDDTDRDLAEARNHWRDKVFLLCGSSREGAALRRLRSLGAAVGSMSEVPWLTEEMVVVEGDPAALLEARRLAPSRTRLVQSASGAKPCFFAGVTTAVSVLPVFLDAVVKCFEEAGVSSTLSRTVARKLIEQALRTTSDARRKNRAPLLSESDAATLVAQYQGLAQQNPKLARHFAQAALLALEASNASSEWAQRALAPPALRSRQTRAGF